MLIDPSLGVMAVVLLLAVVAGVYIGGWIRKKK